MCKRGERRAVTSRERERGQKKREQKKREQREREGERKRLSLTL